MNNEQTDIQLFETEEEAQAAPAPAPEQISITDLEYLRSALANLRAATAAVNFTEGMIAARYQFGQGDRVNEEGVIFRSTTPPAG